MDQFGANLRRWMDEATSRQVAALAAERRGASDPVAACRAYWAVFIRDYTADPNDKVALGRMRGDVCDAPPDAIANGGVVYSAALGSNGWDWREDFRGTDIPVLIVHGDKDPIPVASAYEMGEGLSGATLVPVAGAGHFPPVEQPQAFLRAIQPFVTARPPSR
jgi:pimeloyl-ACP methyl ester carboxylesterase